ncbi:ketoacyl-synt-domain-containing protein [Pseudovirgaria hyperparasitica]|uniref:Ketoacyl-synt-domain-containing protein n=1 Tax=Pseudovirgaria hyperparasitica TaxID=470096 RepID=A0A6A6WJB7_9PEZI|nr:ketoacyl-synt-domain-containing protein [Pseudovirgaria hyperparasitica]KAF2762266.1 ketoacyl-synt-domain-containing protein [Pseudovirgaria hyperparasitica]
MSGARRVAFFGGQGSRSLFSPELCAFAQANAKSSAAAAHLLSACHTAFLDELYNSISDEPIGFRDELRELRTAEDLLNPPSNTHNNPIIQGVTLCLHQLLGYLANTQYTASTGLSLDPKQGELSETVGFCSGVLPAIVVASSKNIAEYIETSTAAVRVAFWIGFRAASFSEQSEDHWRDFPWSLALNGYGPEVVEDYNSDHQDSPDLQLCISAKSSETSFSVAGPSLALRKFRSEYLDSRHDRSSDLVHVHALYHGGHRMEDVLRHVIDDTRRRSINFPSSEDLKRISLRSSIDGQVIKADAESRSLLETAIRSILVDQVDWSSTWKQISQAAPKTEVLAFGPHSRSLLSTTTSDGPAKEIKTEDLSGRGDSSLPAYANEAIAIVGMACQFPQGSNKDMLWETLEKGLNTVEEIPESRFEVSQFKVDPENEKGAGRKMAAKHGNFLDKPWAFDHKFFNISPREAKSMDPQQRLLLQGALNALNDSGYIPDATPTFQKETMGCYVGVATGDYTDNLKDEIDVYYSTGTLRAFLSGKISYHFKWSGPSVVIDTACSASSVALYQACRALNNGDCTSAVAGGVNVISSPDMYIGLSRAHFLSKTGQCKAFDVTADGYCRSEGCGLFVLKKLKDAVAENDRIYGVIRGIEVNQCGNAHSITHPHSETQQALFRQVVERSGVDPTSIGVVEAHGTGTQAGDAAEVSSIQSVFGNRPTNQPLHLTSIKGNIGHAEAASGAAGLTKILLMMNKKKLLPQAGFKNLNPKLASINSHNIKIPTSVEEWRSRRGVPRRALLNNFGAAGSNAAIIVEEAPDGAKPKELVQRSAYPFVISARTVKAVKSYCQGWLQQLDQNPDLHIKDITYTATARRQPYEQRLAFAVTSVEDLKQKLQTDTEPNAVNSMHRKPIGFVFSGQGAVYPGMGKELLQTCTAFSNTVTQCDHLLNNMGFPKVSPLLEDAHNAISPSEYVIVSQCACFVLEVALARTWISFNVVPDVVMGHSLGEYAAMVIAGVLSLPDALKFVATRAKLMVDLCEVKATSMLACNMSSDEAEKQIASKPESFQGLTIACQNSRGDCVVSGPVSALDQFSHHIKSAGAKCKRLDVPYGFHSGALDPIIEPLSKVAAEMKISAPKVAFGSTVSGKLLDETAITPEYFTNQTRNTVLFADLMESLASRSEFNSATYLEIGPAPITLPMIKSGLADGDSQFLPSLKKNENPWTTLVSGITKLALANYTMHWRNVFDGSQGNVIDGPDYPLDKSEMFVPYKEPTRQELSSVQSTEMQDAAGPLVPRELKSNEEGSELFESDTDVLGKFIQGHIVGGVALCPASVYHEMVLEAATRNDNSNTSTGETLTVNEITFDKPLIYDPKGDKRIVQLTLHKKSADGTRGFTFSSFVEGHDEKEKVDHCFGMIQPQKTSKLQSSFKKMAAIAKRQKSHLDGVAKDTFHTRMLYETVFPRVVDYGKEYQSIKNLTVTESGSEGHGQFQLPDPPVDEPFVLSPTFVDTLLHAAGFIANSHVDAHEACICTRVEQINILYDNLDQSQEFKVYCSLMDYIEGTLLGDAYAVDQRGQVVAAVEGMHFKKLSLRAFQNHLARASGRGRTTIQQPAPVTKAPIRNPTTPPPQKAAPKAAGGVGKDEIIATVAETVSKVCEAPPASITAQSELSDLGMDSLMQIELADALKKRFPSLAIDKNALLNSTTVKDIQDHIIAVSPAPSQQKSSNIQRPKSLNLEDTNARLQQAKSSELKYTPPEAPVNKVKDLIAEVCGISGGEIDAESTMESLGMDSLMTIELKTEFKKQLGVEMPEIHGDFTLDTLLSFIDSSNSSETSATLSTNTDSGFISPPSTVTSTISSPTRESKPAIPTLIQSGPKDKPSMYLFHDGSGTVGMYKGLSDLGCTLYGISNPGFGDRDHWAKSISDMATSYASAISASSEKPVVLGGWSFGGVVAFETAQHLARLGKQVKGVILIDSPCPKDHTPLPEEVVKHVLKPMTDSKAGRSAATVANQFKWHAAMLGKYNPPADASEVPYIMLQSAETFDTSGQCGVKYPWLEDQRERARAIDGWQEVLGRKVKTLQIPGDHFQPFTKECVGKVSEQLREAYNIVTK